MENQQKGIAVVWGLFLLCCLLFFVLQPGVFTAENIANSLKRYPGAVLLIYTALSFLRGFTLLPSTPLVLAGMLVMPKEPLQVLCISMMGIVFSSSMLYFFADYLGFSEPLKLRFPGQIEKIEARLRGKTGPLFVMAWAFTPFVATDLICYVAGVLRIPFLQFILAVAVGELALCSMYVFSFSWLPKLF